MPAECAHDDQLERPLIVVIGGKMIVDVAQLLGEACVIAEIAMVEAAGLCLQLQVAQAQLGRQSIGQIGRADCGSGRHQRPDDTSSINFLHHSSPVDAGAQRRAPQHVATQARGFSASSLLAAACRATASAAGPSIDVVALAGVATESPTCVARADSRSSCCCADLSPGSMRLELLAQLGGPVGARARIDELDELVLHGRVALQPGRWQPGSGPSI